PQVRQRCPLLGLCLRPACAGCPAITAWVSAEYRTPVTCHRTPGVSSRAANGTGIRRVQAVKPVVLSGASTLVLTGVRLSCHQAYRMAWTPAMARPAAPLNFTNNKDLTCYWADLRQRPGRKVACLRPGAGS